MEKRDFLVVVLAEKVLQHIIRSNKSLASF